MICEGVRSPLACEHSLVYGKSLKTFTLNRITHWPYMHEVN